MKIDWSVDAWNDLQAVYRFIARDSELRAEQFCDHLIAGTQHLAQFPFSGALVPEDGAYRQIVVSGYRIVYSICEAGIQITAVDAPGRLREERKSL